MKDLKFPVIKGSAPCPDRILSMDEYLEFVLANLEGFDWERYREQKKKQVIKVRFSLYPDQTQDRVAES